MTLRKPPSVEGNPVKSRIWDDITSKNDLRDSDIPTIELLCHWHAVAARCMEDMDVGGDVQVAYSNKMDDIKALPQIATLKQASAEIRAISKQLGLSDGSARSEGRSTSIVAVIQGGNAKRRARASGSR